LQASSLSQRYQSTTKTVLPMPGFLGFVSRSINAPFLRVEGNALRQKAAFVISVVPADGQ